jgi:hypothetical protein
MFQLIEPSSGILLLYIHLYWSASILYCYRHKQGEKRNHMPTNQQTHTTLVQGKIKYHLPPRINKKHVYSNESCVHIPGREDPQINTPVE